MFGYLIISYLFLGGLGAGICMTAAITAFFVPVGVLSSKPLPEHRVLFGRLFLSSAAVLVVSALCLLVDSGRLEAMSYLLFAPQRSYLAVGTWLLIALFSLSLGLGLWWLYAVPVQPSGRFRMRLQGIPAFPARRQAPGLGLPAFGAMRACRGRGLAIRAMHAITLAAAFGVALYTGLFLASMKAVPLWNNPVLPLLFVVSSVSCGITFSIGLGSACGLGAAFAQCFRTFAKVDMVSIVCEVVLAATLVASSLLADGLSPTAQAAVQSAKSLVAGSNAVMWWIGFVGVGIVAALLAGAVFRRSPRVAASFSAVAFAPAACTLIGAFCMRVCIVVAGAHPIAVL